MQDIENQCNQALDYINEFISKLSVYHKNLVAQYQSKINVIRDNNKLSIEEKNDEIKNYLKIIEKNHNLLISNEIIIRKLNLCYQLFAENISKMEADIVFIEPFDLSDLNRELNKVIEDSTNLIKNSINNINSYIKEKKIINNEEQSDILDEVYKLLNLKQEIERLICSITDNNIKLIIDDELKRLEKIKISFKNDSIDVFKNLFIKEHNDLIAKKKEYLSIYHEETNIEDKISISLFENIMDMLDTNFNNVLEYLNNYKTNEIIEYHKIYDILNKSYWDSRYKVLCENIKYPSTSYEKKVVEYQNNYLIEKYNMSLEDINSKISEYEDKHEDILYMEKLYNNAISILKEEISLSFDELCDETNGLCLLEQKVLKLLEDDYIEIKNDIDLLKIDFNYPKTNQQKCDYKLKKLNRKKKIIEDNISILRRKAHKLDEGYY